MSALKRYEELNKRRIKMNHPKSKAVISDSLKQFEQVIESYIDNQLCLLHNSKLHALFNLSLFSLCFGIMYG